MAIPPNELKKLQLDIFGYIPLEVPCPEKQRYSPRIWAMQLEGIQIVTNEISRWLETVKLKYKIDQKGLDEFTFFSSLFLDKTESSLIYWAVETTTWQRVRKSA